jgi:hypothetical protein
MGGSRAGTPVPKVPVPSKQYNLLSISLYLHAARITRASYSRDCGRLTISYIPFSRYNMLRVTGASYDKIRGHLVFSYIPKIPLLSSHKKLVLTDAKAGPPVRPEEVKQAIPREGTTTKEIVKMFRQRLGEGPNLTPQKQFIAWVKQFTRVEGEGETRRLYPKPE